MPCTHLSPGSLMASIIDQVIVFKDDNGVHAHDNMSQNGQVTTSSVTIMAPIPHRTRHSIPPTFRTSTTGSIATTTTPHCPPPQMTTKANILGPTPQLITCPACNRPTLTVCRPVPGRAFTLGMMVSAVMVPVLGVGCVMGAVLAACKPAHDVMHKCPRCLTVVGRWRRL